ncbi:enoyl-CoA hydratase/carnithine racemase [Rhodoligotrophos appendicifer]|uniref:enoyl-CoA hydratase/isomerase family protein n=1 Tax=Rhodoligotrophos appendicifer TaxID=987056 RepID=UPI0011816099|nr:enoyl-CoA hydratase/isomerase family protein [Rhodoligotrophos appendicifer]
MKSPIRVEKSGHIAWMYLDRPEKLNAMTIDTWALMGDLLRELNADLEIRVLVIAGEGRAFLAGHDVGEIKEHSEHISSGQIGASQLREWQKKLQDTTRLIRLVRFPVIAAVQGYAVGAGCELVFACDLVVAERAAKFGFPEVNIGATITNGGTFFMPRKVGLAKARELAYTGEFIDGEEAHRIGLVNRLAAEGEVRAEAAKLAQQIASRAPIAVQAHKVMLDRGMEASLEVMLHFETECMIQSNLSKDSLEGTSAWLEKRQPNFTGT